MGKKLNITGPLLEQTAVCAPILRALPNWFGIEEAIDHYLNDIAVMPTWLAQKGESAIGFLTLNQHFPNSAEIHVMGVLPDYHRQRIGSGLVTAVSAHLRQQQVTYLQVKTLSADHPDPYYARTRAFYQGMGFHPLEVFPTLWGEHNPCLQMIKCL
ncbi:MAG: GNAT family N-acetyltransferase [Chloroflexota bacterium]